MKWLKKIPFTISKSIKGGYDPKVKSKYSVKCPLKGYLVTSPYAKERRSGSKHYDKQTQTWKRGPSSKGTYNHGGSDFACPTGTPVFAATPGQVKYAGWESKEDTKKGFGRYLRIHTKDGHKVYYAHLSKITVGLNSYVYPGEQIGDTGNTGHSTGPHLHFEVRTLKNQAIAVHFDVV